MLYQKLQNAHSEEDIKDIYIQALGLKNVSKNLIDIQTEEIWFEAKQKPTSSYAMFAQLLHYVAKDKNDGKPIPPFLAVIDSKKAAIMQTSHVDAVFQDKSIQWGKSASQVSQATIAQVSNYIGTHFVSFNIKTHEEEFIATVRQAIASGEIIRTQITPDNLKQVFDKWIELIGKEIKGVAESDFALLFFADIMHDGKNSTHENLPAKLLHDGEKPVFMLSNQTYTLASYEGYRQFWAIYHKPPKAEYRNYLLERRDSLIPIDERSFKGAFYTPLHVVDKAYEQLQVALGKNWQTKYLVWDMCCGVGNLEVKHSNHRNIFMSTLDQADIDVMKASKTCVGAHKFQYDYLNDDITQDGQIDYTISQKLPADLRAAIADGKPILVLINPPYAEATNANNTAANAQLGNKAGVAKTAVGERMMQQHGKASNELFTQFLARISKEMPSATVAIFSTLKYVNAPNFEDFRQHWHAQYLGGFIVHSKAFDGLKGDFPIGFLIWQTQHHKKHMPIEQISVEVLDKKARPIGDKTFYNLPKSNYLNVWLPRPKANGQAVIPLKNATSPTDGLARVKTWADDAIAYMYCGVNDVQHATQQTVLFSSPYGGGNGFYITPDNLWQAAVIFSVRQLIQHTWFNHNDQFLQPTSILSDEFKNDCLVWMLFHGKNITASANDLAWNGQNWSIVNHFIPFTEQDVGSDERFESDFMVQYLQDKTLSPEARAVLAQGKQLWQAYFASSFDYKIRDALKLNRSDVGWYQIRKALEAKNAQGLHTVVSFEGFKDAYAQLGEKLHPMVLELGFMRG